MASWKVGFRAVEILGSNWPPRSLFPPLFFFPFFWGGGFGGYLIFKPLENSFTLCFFWCFFHLISFFRWWRCFQICGVFSTGPNFREPNWIPWEFHQMKNCSKSFGLSLKTSWTFLVTSSVFAPRIPPFYPPISFLFSHVFPLFSLFPKAEEEEDGVENEGNSPKFEDLKKEVILVALAKLVVHKVVPAVQNLYFIWAPKP